MKKDQAKILAAAVYQAIQDKQGKELSKVIANFSAYLSEHYLLNMIPKILGELEKIYFTANNIVSAKLVSKDELSSSEINKITELIKNKTKQTVEIKMDIDKNLLGGAVIKYNDKIIDLSLKNQLNSLAKQLSN